jgi:hypothetical protein
MQLASGSARVSRRLACRSRRPAENLRARALLHLLVSPAGACDSVGETPTVAAGTAALPSIVGLDRSCFLPQPGVDSFFQQVQRNRPFRENAIMKVADVKLPA